LIVYLIKAKKYFQNRLLKKENKLLLHSHKNGAVAQSVEQKTENLCVGGSIPSYTTQKIK